MMPIRPSLDETIVALKTIAAGNTDTELWDLIAAAEYVNFDHQSAAEEYATKTGWGVCETCETVWPCVTWKTTEYAITEWLIKSSTCLMARRHR